MNSINEFTPITDTEQLKFPKSNNNCEIYPNIGDTLVAVFDNLTIKDTFKAVYITLDEMIEGNRTGVIETYDGDYDNREIIAQARQLKYNIENDIDKENSTIAYKKLKTKIAVYVLQCCSFKGDEREDESVEHNQLYYFDIDDCAIEDPKEIIIKEYGDTSLVYMGRSMGGKGWGGLVWGRKCKNKEEYKYFSSILFKQFDLLIKETGKKTDSSCTNSSRVNCASQDPDLYYNPFNRTEFQFDESLAINVAYVNTDYESDKTPLDNVTLQRSIDYLLNLSIYDRLITHTPTKTARLNKISWQFNCAYAAFNPKKSDDENTYKATSLFLSLFPLQEKAEAKDSNGSFIIKSSEEDGDSYSIIKGIIKNKYNAKWNKHFDGGRRIYNLAVAHGFNIYTNKQYEKPNIDILNKTYIDYISTGEVIKYIKTNCFKKGKYTYVVAPTGTGKTKIIIETAIYLHHTGEQVVIVNPSADCTLQLVNDINKAAGYECAYALVGKENSTSEDDENKSIPQKFRDNVNKKIIVATQSAIAFLYDIGYELLKQYMIAENSIIFDESHTITSDMTYRADVCNTMYKIIDFAKLTKSPILAFSATPTKYDDLVWGDFDKLDFRKLVNFTNKVNIHIVYSENNDDKMQNLFKIGADSYNNKGKIIIRCNSIEKITIIHQKLIDSKLFRENSIKCLHAKNRKNDDNIEILDSLHNYSLIPDDCDILLTTSIIDTSLNILNDNITYIYIDSHKDTPETMTQAISRVRNAKDIYVLAINKEDNSIKIESKEKRVNNNYLSYKDTIDKVISQVHYADIDKNSYINSELDNLITLEGGVKYCNKTALACRLNTKFTAILNTPEKIQIIADRYRNNFIIKDTNDFFIAPKVTANQEEFAISFNEILKEKVIENKATNRQTVEDLIFLSSHKEDFFLKCYIEGLVSDECADILHIKIDNVTKTNTNKGRYIDTELKRVNNLIYHYGFLDWQEAVRFSFDVSNDIFGDIKLLKELIHICVGKTYHNPFQSINTKQVFDTYTLVCLFSNKLCNENMVLTVKQLKEELIKFLKVEHTEFNLTDFDSIVKKILDLIPYVIVIDNVKVTNDEGKRENRKKFIRIKSVAEIIDTLYELLKSKGVTKIQPVDKLINPDIAKLQEMFGDVINITKDTFHDFNVTWGDTSFNVSLFLEA